MVDIVGFMTPLAALLQEKLKQYIALALAPFSILLHDICTESESISYNIQVWYDSQVTLRNYSTAAVATATGFARQYRHVQNVPLRVILDWFSKANTKRLCGEVYSAMDKAMDPFNTWTTNCCWYLTYWIAVYLRTFKELGHEIRSKETFIRNNAGPWLTTAAAGCWNNTLLVWNCYVEPIKVMVHHCESIDPQIIAAVESFALAALLVYYHRCIWNAYRRSRQQREILLELARQIAAPLSRLQNMQLEMILRKPMVGSYVYDNTVKQSLGNTSFRSTLQQHKPHKPPTFSTLPAPIRMHILSLALCTASSFAWNPTTHSLRLATPNITFHRAWRFARTFGHVLPGNNILIDARPHPAPAGATVAAASTFVPRPPCGREQLLDLLAIMSLPAVARGLWLERVAESLRAGERWVIVVREAAARVWSFDVGLMVACFGTEAFVKAFPGMAVEYRIVMDHGGERGRVAELVRQLGEAARLGYRDSRFRVLVEGLDGWEDEVVGEEFQGEMVVDLVEGVVAEVNGGN